VTLLLDREDCLLLVIDAQSAFYGAAGEPEGLRIALDRAAWLAGVATALAVPAVVTEEDATHNGPTAARILAVLPSEVPVYDKAVFGAADVPEILAAVEATGRRTAVLVGLETDVCVSHTALGLLDRGWRVATVADATFAPADTHAAGLRRMSDAGAAVVHAKGVYYEWIRTLASVRAFELDHPALADPPGFGL
jgi:nicotinamidase-related amidase